jgi:RimJ/RimL family protein N-acetyltransferase
VSVIETERLSLRRLGEGDAAFVLELLNEPSFLRNIGDRGVRTTDDALRYIANGPVASYEKFGFGLWLVELRASGAALGMCGLIKRDALEDVDIGFAFLPRFWSNGYARESAAAVMRHGREALGLHRIVAITAPDNQGSIRVLETIGLRFEGMIRLPGEAEDVRLFASE